MKLKKTQVVTLILLLSLSLTSFAQVGGWNPKLIKESNESLDSMVKRTPKLESFINESYGYAVFPKVTKAGIGIGGAIGKGIVYKNKEIVGKSKLKQASFGIQLGGEQYSEVIFFENEASFKKFINGKLKFDGQASAVFLKKGASIDLAYQDGVAVFTMSKGGIMVDASLGGQHFTYDHKKSK